MASNSAGNSGGETPWAWLGLLKWSLSYSDGTSNSTPPAAMSEENRKFLESVMKDGIIDEGERMHSILKELSASLDTTRQRLEQTSSTNTTQKEETKSMDPLNEEEMTNLLLELRDIVEQIDYARAFAAMGGLEFTLGMALMERRFVPNEARKSALSILATLSQNNPPVQERLWKDFNALDKLSRLYFHEFATPTATTAAVNAATGDDDKALYHTWDETNNDGSVQAKIIQAVSACVRGHASAEHALCSNKFGISMIASALGFYSSSSSSKPPMALQRKTLFLLRALLTSDFATTDARIATFIPVLKFIMNKYVDPEKTVDAELREMTLSLIRSLIPLMNASAQRDIFFTQDDHPTTNNTNNVLSYLTSVGIKQISSIRQLPLGGEERDYASVELELWEDLLVQLAKLQKDHETLSQGDQHDDAEEKEDSNNVGPPLLLGPP